LRAAGTTPNRYAARHRTRLDEDPTASPIVTGRCRHRGCAAIDTDAVIDAFDSNRDSNRLAFPRRPARSVDEATTQSSHMCESLDAQTITVRSRGGFAAKAPLPRDPAELPDVTENVRPDTKCGGSA
jgi:hypothetical protein